MKNLTLLTILLAPVWSSMNMGEGKPTPTATEIQEKTQLWTCSMHPQIKAEEPGKCPICFMELIPMNQTKALPRNVIELDPSKQYSGAILTYPVKYQHDQKNLILYGRVNLIPSDVYRVTAWVGGRIDQLFVSSVGEKVKAGDPLFKIYSPSLIASQQEMIQALNLLKTSKQNSSHFLSLEANIKAIRQKLRFLGLAESDLAKIEKRKIPTSHIVIHAQRSGVVRHVAINEGEYVKEGTPIFLIANMSTLWVEASVYEDDLQTIRGQIKSLIILDSHPKDEITAKLERIDPFINPKTRSSRAIFSIKNPKGEYHESGFARVQIESHSKKGLLVPHSAALFTGQKAVVFVKKGNLFTSKLVRILEKTESYYRVLGDLKEGDQVVAQGTFKIDSEFQLQAKESMMSSKELVSPYGARLDFRSPVERATDWLKLKPPAPRLINLLTKVRALYLELQVALAEDSFDDAKGILTDLRHKLNGISLDPLAIHESQVLKLLRGDLKISMQKAIESTVFKAYRACFARLSRWMIVLSENAWLPREADLKKMFCPMAFDKKGGFWIQEDEETMNPYFGTKMQKCGELKQWDS
jgi:membrane fusion protein, copper/silver efflux system